MRILGLEITRARPAAAVAKRAPEGLAAVPRGGGGWFPVARVSEPYTGAWQQNADVPAIETVLGFGPVQSCVSLISSDIGKLRILLMQEDGAGIWSETEAGAFSPVLRKPNRYQTRIKFLEQWISSKLIHGNAYILKERDQRGVVVALYVLDSTRVKALVAADGSVFYQLQADNLAGVDGPVTVPASEVIHDLMIALFHPLVGVSPITACGLAALQGLRVQNNSSTFFANGSMPGGVLSAPGTIADETAKRIMADWETNFGGQNVGRVAVLGDGLKFEQMALSAVDAQLIEQLKWTSENVCSAFHVPAYMIGIGPLPTYNNIEALSQQYYSQCLQNLIECVELLLDEGLALPKAYGTELDLDGLLRMDTATKVKAAGDSIGSGALSPNEARARFFELGPVPGGESPYLQQQNYSLADLSRRSASPDPFASGPPAPEKKSPVPEALEADAVRAAVRKAWEAAA